MELKQQVVEILHSLKVLASIKENDRVKTLTGIYIQRSDMLLQGIMRWLGSENRTSNISCITKIFEKAFQLCEELMMEEAKMEEKQLLNRLITEIFNARNGVLNLKVTYQKDSHILASLDVVGDMVDDQLARTKLQAMTMQQQDQQQQHL